MKTYKRNNLIRLLLVLLMPYSTLAQPGAEPSGGPRVPEVGKPCPDFTLRDVSHYSSKTVSLKDFRGRWLFLDFWSLGCTSCVQSFPNISQLQKEFRNDVQFLLVAKFDTRYNRNVKEIFDKLSKKRDLGLPCAYDSVLRRQWKVSSLPHIVIVNPEGTVTHVASGRDLTIEKIRDLIKGKSVYFHPKERNNPEFSPELSWGDGPVEPGTVALYSSVLVKWNGEKQHSGFDIEEWSTFDDKYQADGWTVSMVPLFALYNYAYFGTASWTRNDSTRYGNVSREPILELSDTSLFQFDFKFEVGKGTYNYAVRMPPEHATRERLMKQIQQDLQSAFGYKVNIETRSMPVWNLVASPAAAKKIMTKGGQPFSSAGDRETGYSAFTTGFTLRNHPITLLMSALTTYVMSVHRAPFLDATGIKGNIDFEIEADLTNFDDIRNELRKQGLDFVPAEKEMKVLVIRDDLSR